MDLRKRTSQAGRWGGDVCKMALADGTVVTGDAFGHRGEAGGELCFNTSMTGYQEIMTDPSYHGQLMMMTYPHIGNYGASDRDMEATRPMVAGLIVRSVARNYSNLSADESLSEFMKRFELVGLSGVDTRSLVRHIRSKGVINAVVSSVDLNDESLVEKARAWPSMEGLELASRVTTREPYVFADGAGPRIAVVDFGVKLNILREFAGRGGRVQVFPADAQIEHILASEPDGIFFSNGPGDPRAMPEAVDLSRAAAATGLPIFGICLGHQLLSLAEGFEVYKMMVGHRGANHPVRNLETGHVEVTTQNHGFAVNVETIRDDRAVVSHVNLNDETIEGLRYKRFAGYSVQYHPEASPGPHDSRYLFDKFFSMMPSRIDSMGGDGAPAETRMATTHPNA